MTTNMKGLIVTSAVLLVLGACTPRVLPPVSAEPPADMDARIDRSAAQHATEAGRVGNIFTSVAHEEGDRKDWEVTVEAGKCYWWVAAGDDVVEGIYLILWNEQGKEVTKRKEKSKDVVLAHCAQSSGLYRLQTRIFSGRGHFAIGLYEKGAPKAQQAPKGPDLGGIIEELAKSAAPNAMRVGDFYRGSDDWTQWFANMEKGKCYWLVGAGDDEVSELSLYLWGPDKKRVTENKSENNRVSVGHCSNQDGMYRFEVKAASGSGAYQVGFYESKK